MKEQNIKSYSCFSCQYPKANFHISVHSSKLRSGTNWVIQDRNQEANNHHCKPATEKHESQMESPMLNGPSCLYQTTLQPGLEQGCTEVRGARVDEVKVVGGGDYVRVASLGKPQALGSSKGDLRWRRPRPAMMFLPGSWPHVLSEANRASARRRRGTWWHGRLVETAQSIGGCARRCMPEQQRGARPPRSDTGAQDPTAL
uniref:Pco061870a n=1 Tax=Arundo donax TaxID=35708 RepID=A0A0A9GR61_ARUDO